MPRRLRPRLPPIGEDVDLCLRAGAARYAIGFCADAWISHPAEGYLTALMRRGYRQGWSISSTSPPSGPDRRRARPPPGPARARRLGVAPVRHRPDALAAEERAMMLLARTEYAARMVGAPHVS